MATSTPKRSAGAAAARGEHLYDFAPLLFVLLDLSGVVRDINETGCRLLGRRHSKLLGLPFRTLVDDPDRRTFLEHLRRCRLVGGGVESELTLRSQDGGTIPVRLFSRLAAGHDAFPTIALDLTEHHALDRARQVAIAERDIADRERDTAQANETAKDHLIAVVSHELRNPLSPALAAAEALSSWPDLPDPARQLAEIIKRNIHLEARLVNDLLDIARVTHGQLDLKLQVVDLHAAIMDALQACLPAAEARHVTISLDFQASRHHTRGDDDRFRQVLWNLLSNAINFSEPGGGVLIRTSSDAGGLVRVSIRDQGRGMDPETIAELFQPFQRRTDTPDQRGGLGLGLTITKGIIEAHGGRIWASSQGKGRGSTFEFELSTGNFPELPPADRARAAQDPAEESGRSERPGEVHLRDQLRYQATHDHLTGVWNRRMIREQLEHELHRAAREGRSLAVGLADIDHFKDVNDRHGHRAGDEVLQEVVTRIRGVMRDYDAVGRYGGEEFMLILPGCQSQVAIEFAERTRKAVAATPMEAAGVQTPITLSIGIAWITGGGIDADALIHAADAALYRAKAAGRNCVKGMAESTVEVGEVSRTTAGRVLIVEDHQDTGALMSMFLRQHGYDVTVAQTLADGLKELDREWDVVLSDIGLADGSGLDIARAATKSSHRPGRMIAISGYGTRRDIAASRRAGFDDHVIKPVEMKQLLGLLRG